MEFAFWLAILPFGIFTLFLLGLKQTLLRTSVVTFLSVLALAFGAWNVNSGVAIKGMEKGFWTAFDILVIIFGAVAFLEVLKEYKTVEHISRWLGSFSRDYRVKVIILAWLFEGFLEGTAGFGIPCAVVAPLLVGLGLNPLQAVIISLLGNSTPGAFGAVGTPVRIGFAGLDTAAVPSMAGYLSFVGVLVPVFMLIMLVRKEPEAKKQFFEALPFALWSGLAFVIPFAATVFLGQEFPSILGSLIGMLAVLVTLKLGWFVPSQIREGANDSQDTQKISTLKALAPYLGLIVLLIAGKFLIGSQTITISYIFSKHNLSLYNPGLAFVIIAVIMGMRIKGGFGYLAGVFKKAFSRTIEPFLVVAAMSSLVQIMINSGNNTSGWPSMLTLMANQVSSVFLPFWAPLIGSFGSFLTGSVTVSNLMFGNLLAQASKNIGINTSLVLALQLVGAAAANMIALADMLAAEAIVGLKNNERQVLKGVIIPCLIYVVLVGLIGLVISMKFA